MHANRGFFFVSLQKVIQGVESITQRKFTLLALRQILATVPTFYEIKWMPVTDRSMFLNVRFLFNLYFLCACMHVVSVVCETAQKKMHLFLIKKLTQKKANTYKHINKLPIEKDWKWF